MSKMSDLATLLEERYGKPTMSKYRGDNMDIVRKAMHDRYYKAPIFFESVLATAIKSIERENRFAELEMRRLILDVRNLTPEEYNKFYEATRRQG
jgi:hypothetical protein